MKLVLITIIIKKIELLTHNITFDSGSSRLILDKFEFCRIFYTHLNTIIYTRISVQIQLCAH
jgi:hypothetical protein